MIVEAPELISFGGWFGEAFCSWFPWNPSDDRLTIMDPLVIEGFSEITGTLIASWTFAPGVFPDPEFRVEQSERTVVQMGSPWIYREMDHVDSIPMVNGAASGAFAVKVIARVTQISLFFPKFLTSFFVRWSGPTLKIASSP